MPLPGVMVDVWHSDHLGVYSDVQDQDYDTTGRKFLRGYQVTDVRGQVRFITIYPGWYGAWTVHIHFKIRSPAAQRPEFAFTSQLYFEDTQSDRVFAQPPYAGRAPRRVRNDADWIYRRGGSQLLLALTPSGSGYAGIFQIAITDG